MRRAWVERAVLAAGAAALAVALFQAGRAWSREREARASLEASKAALAATQERLARLDVRRPDSTAGQVLMTLEAPPQRVVAELSVLLPADVRLDSLALRYGPTLEIDMQVVARHRGAYDSFLERLEASPLFDEVTPGEENREAEVRGSVRAVYRGPAA
jgi:Tfp pilus assembly protein PilN